MKSAEQRTKRRLAFRSGAHSFADIPLSLMSLFSASSTCPTPAPHPGRDPCPGCNARPQSRSRPRSRSQPPPPAHAPTRRALPDFHLLLRHADPDRAARHAHRGAHRPGPASTTALSLGRSTLPSPYPALFASRRSIPHQHLQLPHPSPQRLVLPLHLLELGAAEGGFLEPRGGGEDAWGQGIARCCCASSSSGGRSGGGGRGRQRGCARA